MEKYLIFFQRFAKFIIGNNAKLYKLVYKLKMLYNTLEYKHAMDQRPVSINLREGLQILPKTFIYQKARKSKKYENEV